MQTGLSDVQGKQLALQRDVDAMQTGWTDMQGGQLIMRGDVDAMQTGLSDVQGKQLALQRDVDVMQVVSQGRDQAIRDDMHVMNRDLVVVRGQYAGLSNRVDGMQGEFTTLKTTVETLETKLQARMASAFQDHISNSAVVRYQSDAYTADAAHIQRLEEFIVMQQADKEAELARMEAAQQQEIARLEAEVARMDAATQQEIARMDAAKQQEIARIDAATREEIARMEAAQQQERVRAQAEVARLARMNAEQNEELEQLRGVPVVAQVLHPIDPVSVMPQPANALTTPKRARKNHNWSMLKRPRVPRGAIPRQLTPSEVRYAYARKHWKMFVRKSGSGPTGSDNVWVADIMRILSLILNSDAGMSKMHHEKVRDFMEEVYGVTPEKIRRRLNSKGTLGYHGFVMIPEAEYGHARAQWEAFRDGGEASVDDADDADDAPGGDSSDDDTNDPDWGGGASSSAGSAGSAGSNRCGVAAAVAVGVSGGV
jgi:glucan-binding YG repeat protein